MLTTLRDRPSEAFAKLHNFLEYLMEQGIRVEGSYSHLEAAWSKIENPCSSDLAEPTAKDFCYHLKPRAVSAEWGLVFRDSKGTKEAALNEILVDYPEATMDLLLRKIAQPEWVATENYLQKHSNVIAEPNVVVGPACEIGEAVVLESGVRIGARVKIGAGTRIGAGSRISDDTIIGEGCYFRGPVSIGGQGFGFVRYPGTPVPKHRKHIARVLVGDGVQLGSFIAVDRGVLEDTVIGNFTATDNFVHVGHNSRLGKHNIICGFVVLGGSTIFGDYVTSGGLVVSRGHLRVGDGAQIGGFTVIGGNIPAGGQVRGYPARSVQLDLKILAVMNRLPEMYDKLKKIKGLEA